MNKRVGFVSSFFAVSTLAILAGVSLGARPTPKVPSPKAPATRAAAVVAPARTAALAAAWPSSERGSVDSDVFELAFSAAACAVRSGDVREPDTLTVIDYSVPSTKKRLWVFDLESRQLLHEELVAHGQGSGGNVPTSFSNQDESHRSSLGLFVTNETYIGKHGYSLRLDGLDKGFNDRARQRAIVMHGASYVSDAFARSQGRLGRSWGCPALRQSISRKVIDDVKGGNLVFAYYPDENWLEASKYLGDCEAAD